MTTWNCENSVKWEADESVNVDDDRWYRVSSAESCVVKHHSRLLQKNWILLPPMRPAAICFLEGDSATGVIEKVNTGMEPDPIHGNKLGNILLDNLIDLVQISDNNNKSLNVFRFKCRVWFLDSQTIQSDKLFQ